MAWSKTRKRIVWGTMTVLALVAIAEFVLLRHKIAYQLTLAGGKRAIANHIAAPADLTRHYSTPASYFDKITAFPAWQTVPRGFQVFHNVPLDIGGMMCLWGEGNAKMGLVFPEHFLGIAVNQKFETLYVYHGAFFASPNKTPVCQVVFHYEDDSTTTNQLLYGIDILDWVANRNQTGGGPSGPHSKLAWRGGTFTPGQNRPLRFCLTAIENPYPALEVTSIDLISCKSRTAACIMALTMGKSGLMK